MVPLDRALVSSYMLSIVTTSLSTAVWPQFATQRFRGGTGSLRSIGSYVSKYSGGSRIVIKGMRLGDGRFPAGSRAEPRWRSGGEAPLS